ncbi:MAG: NRDE family protein [Pseudomonadales bacterium]|nr:NRDE family protein [Pseudomonadales bacterium]
MCLIALAYRVHPAYPLLVVANRDEFHHRPTQTLAPWPDVPQLFAGRDLEQGGTWMGVSERGRWSAVTNFREPEGELVDGEKEFVSRGKLPAGFLAGDMPSREYLSAIAAVSDQYRGFNLLVYDAQVLAYYSNREKKARALEPGIYTLSNHLLDTPWPKNLKAGKKLGALMQQPVIRHEHLTAVLRDREPVEAALLPDTGIGQQLEHFLSPCFILGERYGTRNTTSVIFEVDGGLAITEENWSVDGEQENLQRFILGKDASGLGE